MLPTSFDACNHYELESFKLLSYTIAIIASFTYSSKGKSRASKALPLVS